jgi:hypothetical protein
MKLLKSRYYFAEQDSQSLNRNGYYNEKNTTTLIALEEFEAIKSTVPYGTCKIHSLVRSESEPLLSNQPISVVWEWKAIATHFSATT